MKRMIDEFKAKRNGQPIAVKPTILATIANISLRYFCSRDFSTTDPNFQQFVRNADNVVRELNSGSIVDFIPCLLPFTWKYCKKMTKCTEDICDFIKENIIQDRRKTWPKSKTDRLDFVDSLINHVESDLEPKIQWLTAINSIEDIVGASGAVSNVLTSAFAFIALSPESQRKMQEEIDNVMANKCNEDSSNVVDLWDRSQTPYTEAVFYETLRMLATPIIPRAASQDSSIGGHFVEKGTVILFNCHKVFRSPDLWDEPSKFKPERFIKNGKFVKPDHLIPLGAGRRSCLGIKMTQYMACALIANCMHHFNFEKPADVTYAIPEGMIALDEKSYEMFLTDRP